jgi:hypothetical protein
MSVKAALSYLWRLAICALAFFPGITLGSMAARMLGLPDPGLPAGADAATLSMYFLLPSVLLALALGILARGLAGGFMARWLILAFLTWVAIGITAAIEAAIYTTFAPTGLFTIVTFLGASILCGAAAAICFPAERAGSGSINSARVFFARRQAWDWVWRLLAAVAAFPAIYVFYGMLVAPFVTDYYREQLFGLNLPGWNQILAAQLLRSLLFLAACLPVLIAWQRRSWELAIALGWALFVLVGLLSLIPAYWMPVGLRLIHGAEILADSFVYALALVLLLAPREPAAGWKMTPAHRS